VDGPTRRLAAVLAAAALVTAVAVPAAGTAGSSGRLRDLRRAGDALAARARSAELELYALDSRLARARSEAALAQERLRSLRAQRTDVARQVALARRTNRVAQRRLAERLLALYQDGETDPVAIVLGARSINEVTTRLESMEAIAGQDRAIVRQSAGARARLSQLGAALARREVRVARVVEVAQARATALDQALLHRRAYLAGLRRNRNLTFARLTTLERRVEMARARTAHIAPARASEAPAVAAASAPTPAPDVTGPRQLTVSATAYALTGRTATGLPLGIGVVAVDPNVIPLGTRMTIPGYGEGVAADTGGAVQGAVIDVWFPSVAEARAWGRRVVTVTLY
jgi:3D (Asp-Asp-Asp) domain-containing protein